MNRRIIRTGPNSSRLAAFPMNDGRHTPASPPILKRIRDRTHRCRFSLLIAALLAAATPVQAADYFPLPDSQGGWRALKDADQILRTGRHGSRSIGSCFRFHATLQPERRTARGPAWLSCLRAPTLGRDFHRDANPDMASTGKAFTSIACGIMLHEFHDKIPDGLDTKVFTMRYLPEAFPLDDPAAGGDHAGPVALHDGRLQRRRTGSRRHRPWQGRANETGAGARYSQPRHVVDPHAALDRSGAGYSYSSPSPHVASIVLRHVTGMELQDYIRERLAKPMGWGAWGYCLHRGDYDMPHANGAGSIALHATDALRFGYCLLHGGKWGDAQLVPADYIARCNKPSPYNPHCPFSLQFEHNADRHVCGAPRDAFYKSGAGGFGIFIVPSLDLVIYKLGGNNGQYDPALTRNPADVQARNEPRRLEADSPHAVQ